MSEINWQERAEKAERALVGLRASMRLIADRLEQTKLIVDFLNSRNPPPEVVAAWRALVYASGVRAQTEAECDPSEHYISRESVKPLVEALRKAENAIQRVAGINDENRLGWALKDVDSVLSKAKELGL